DLLCHPFDPQGRLSLHQDRSDEPAPRPGHRRGRVDAAPRTPARYPRNDAISRNHRTEQRGPARRPLLRGITMAGRAQNSFVPIAVVVLAIIVLWYVFSAILNTPWQQGVYARADVSGVPFTQFLADVYAQQRPVLPAPHQV